MCALRFVLRIAKCTIGRMRFSLFTVLLLLVLFLSVVVRTHDLTNSPNGLNIDESQNAYIGRYIIENGHDVYGQKWPLFYADKRGDYPPVVPMYFAALGTYIFGPTIFGARIVLALFAALTVIPVFYLALWFSDKKKWVALAVAFVFALNPWHISLSRVATEGTLALFFFSLGMTLIVYGTDRIRSKRLLIVTGSALTIFSMLIYPSFRILVPISLSTVSIWYWLTAKKYSRVMLLFVLLSILLVAYTSSTEWGKGRFVQTSYFKLESTHQDNPFAKFIFNEESALVARLFYNRYVYVVYTFVKEYYQYFSLDFLLGQRGQPVWFTTSLGGLMLISHFILIGLYLLYKTIARTPLEIDRKKWVLLLILTALAPIPAAMTNELTPSLHRAVQMSMYLSLLTIPALCVLLGNKRRLLPALVFGLIAGVELIFFIHTYFAHINLSVGVQRQTGRYEIIQYLSQNKSKYADVIWYNSGWPQMDYLYFTGQFRLDPAYRFTFDLQMPHYENIHFFRADCPSPTQRLMYDELSKSFDMTSEKVNASLLVTTCDFLSSSPGDGWKLLHTIYGKNSMAMYHVYAQ